MKSLVLAALLAFGFQAHAATNIELSVVQSIAQATVFSGPDWKVGDTADYTIKGGIISGKMHVFVREQNATGTWIVQNADLGMLGKQVIEILYSPQGEVLELIVNGQKQTPPSPGDQEIVETRQETITVTKGTFDCIYVKIRDVKSNSMTEAWINMQLIPITGMAKSIAQSQFGPITLELTAFNKAN